MTSPLPPFVAPACPTCLRLRYRWYDTTMTLNMEAINKLPEPRRYKTFRRALARAMQMNHSPEARAALAAYIEHRKTHKERIPE